MQRFAGSDATERRRLSVEIRLALYERPVASDICVPLLAAWRAQRGESPGPAAVRSSALVEDVKGASFAGQFESFLGIDDESTLLTAVRACWAALWTTNARRYMENHALSPADTAMAVLIQPLVDAQASGGGLSETADGGMLISATWGLGSAIAQGQIVPDHIVLSRQGFLRKIEVGRKRVTTRARTYAEGRPGELFVITGSTGYLEISVNQGSAAELVGCQPGSSVEITLK